MPDRKGSNANEDQRAGAHSGVTLPRYAAPAGLASRITHALDEEHARVAEPPSISVTPTGPSRTPRFAPTWVWPRAALFLVCVATAASLGYWRGADGAHSDDPLVASHVRALVGDHLVDVASSDQHTVKPWLDARLDYAPPVADFAPDSVPLTGGRIEFVAGRRVAVLVYRLRLHVISVYVAPTGALPASLGRGAESLGYRVTRWTDGAMEHVAISDVNAADLARVASLMQARAAMH